MAEYIEREAALAYISANTIDCNPDHFAMDTFEGYGQWMHNSGWNGGITASRCAVKDIPAADVREVVLCRECINRFMTPNGWRCHYVEWAIEDDDYCSCGERKDGADMRGEEDGT